MLIESIFMELRTRLRSCNVYITTGVDLTKNCNLRINIQANGIILNYFTNDDQCLKKSTSYSSIDSLSDCYSEEDSDVSIVIPIDNFCKIIPNSMSGLRIDKKNISFRILTEPKNGCGNFYTEVLTTATVNSNISNKLKVTIKDKENLKILCSNCSNIISNNLIRFDRILELPTCNLDMTEWFCHNHGDHSHNQTNNIEIKPNKSDLLYRLTFFLVNVSGLSEKTNKFNSKREVYHCNRCLAWLGLKTKDSVKFFNSTTKYDQGNGQSTVFEVKSNHINDVNVNDFIYTIESIMKEFNIGFQYTVMCKMVLECTVSANKKQFILIWVMDKELQVLQSCENITDDDRVKLKSNYLTKILYKVEASQNDEVDVWIADPTVVTTEVSKSMFVNGIEHLNKMSMKIPECFRTTNGFMVSYLQM